jgi:uncharacterized membrane protein YfcA
MDMTWFQIVGMLLVGIFAGCVGALTGISGGLMVTPFLTLFFGVPIRYAIACQFVLRDCRFVRGGRRLHRAASD